MSMDANEPLQQWFLCPTPNLRPSWMRHEQCRSRNVPFICKGLPPCSHYADAVVSPMAMLVTLALTGLAHQPAALSYWRLPRRSRTTIQIMVAIISVRQLWQ
jgi:hypothetical protein